MTVLSQFGAQPCEKKTEEHVNYSQTSRKQPPTGPRVSVRLREVSAYKRAEKKCTRGHIMHQNKYFKDLRPLVTVLSIKGLLDVAFLLYCT